MGLLDDAIREHLELKRKHGAPDDEISRAEHEALTPARREAPAAAVEPLGDAEPPPPPAPGEESLSAPPPPPADLEPVADAGELEAPAGPGGAIAASAWEGREAPPVDEPVFADEYASDPAPAGYDEDDPEPRVPIAYRDEDDDLLPPEPVHSGPAAHPPLESTEPIDADDDVPESGPGSPPPEGDDPYRARTSILDDPLRGEDPPPAPATDTPPPDDADVLEETPEFLQETPEHDKLWFEQKPPRDFDFE